MTINTEILQEIGLTKSEVQVYLALLELGKSSTGKIVDKAHVSSSKIYEILERLIDKGLASFIIERGTKYFEAASPERIFDYIKDKQRKINDQTEEVKKLLPELKLKQELAKTKSEATIYRGVKGMHAAFYSAFDTLKKNDELLILGVPKRTEVTNRFFLNYKKECGKKNIKIKELINFEARKELQNQTSELKNVEKKYTQEVTPAAINIFNDQVIIFPKETNEPLLIAIDNRDIADSFRTHFKNLWNQDVVVSTGFESFKSIMYEYYEDYKKNKEYLVLGGAFGRPEDHEKYTTFFTELNKERVKAGIKARMLFQQGEEKVIERYRKNIYQEQPIEVKFLPYRTTNPIPMFILENKTIILIQEKEPVIISINNPKITESFKQHFELLWNQEVTVTHGLDAAQQLFEEQIEEGGIDYIGARGYFYDARPEYIKGWKQRMIENKCILRNIVEPDTRGHPITGLPFTKVKYTLSPQFSKLNVFWIYKKKVCIVNWTKEEPIIITIYNPEIVKVYKEQFEQLWNQNPVTYRGENGIKIFFDQLLKEKDVYFIGGNFGITKYLPEYWKTYKEKRIQAQSFWHDLLDPELEVSESLSGTPFYESRMLPTELKSPHVICLYGNTTANIIWKEKDTIINVMEDKELTQSYKQQFDYFWNLPIRTYIGQESIRQLFTEMLDYGDYDVLAEGMKVVNCLGEEFFIKWQNKKVEKRIKSRGIIGERYRNEVTVLKSAAQFKFISGYENPGLTYIYKDKIISINLAKIPVATLIKSKEAAEIQQEYFNLLWNQEVQTTKGLDNVHNAFNKMLNEMKPDEEYYVIGASWQGEKDSEPEFYKEYHQRRIDKKVSAKLLFVAGTEERIKKFNHLYKTNLEVRILPQNVYEGMQINLFHNKVLMFVWKEKDPLIFLIEDSTVYNTFKTYFDTMWTQSKPFKIK